MALVNCPFCDDKYETELGVMDDGETEIVECKKCGGTYEIECIIEIAYDVTPIESARQKAYRQEWEVRNLPGQIHLFDVQMATID